MATAAFRRLAGVASRRRFGHSPVGEVERNLPLLFLLMLQATSSAPAENTEAAVPQQCATPAATNGEVVVCARREAASPYRIEQSPPAPSEAPKAEMQLADGVSAAAETEGHEVGGFPSNRVMVRLKIKF